MYEQLKIGAKARWFLFAMVTATIALAGHARAKDAEKDFEQRDEQEDQRADTKDLPPAVMQAAEHYAPGLRVEDVKVREIKGHPKMYVIDGESKDRDVVLHIAEGGEIHEVRFQDRPEGVKPRKLTHSTEELPDAVRQTAMRVFPEMEVTEVRSHESPHEERVYHITGRAVEDGNEREVVLAIEADGDLLEARVFKPRLVRAADSDESDRNTAKGKSAGKNSDKENERDPSDD